MKTNQTESETLATWFYLSFVLFLTKSCDVRANKQGSRGEINYEVINGLHFSRRGVCYFLKTSNSFI